MKKEIKSNPYYFKVAKERISFTSKNIKRLMLEHEDNQITLARKMNISQALLSSSLNGRRAFTLINLQKIADLYSCSISEIIGGNELHE